MRPFEGWQVTAVLLVATAGAPQVPRSGSEDMALIQPIRRSPDAPPVPPPELPKGAADIAPVTFEVLTQRVANQARLNTSRQTMSRTKDRVHVAVGGREWLFERNVIDPRRTSATLVDHERRSIVLHEESALRNRLGISGWADVLVLGMDARALGALTPIDEWQRTAGIRFRRHVPQSNDSSIVELWWNEELHLPGLVVIRDRTGVTRVSVERVQTGVDAEVLRSPAERFPGYRVVDLAEWLETVR